jgi:hypothetical protein
MLILMKRYMYDTVTQIPILVPARLIPGERPVGTDTFRIHFLQVPGPRRKGDRRPPETPRWEDEPVVQLKSSYLAPGSKQAKFIWDALGPATKKELMQLIILRDALQRGDSFEEMRKLYREMEFRIFGEEGTDEPWPPELLEMARQRLGPLFQPKTELQSVMESFHDAGRHTTVLSALMTDELDGARIVLWWTGSEFVPAVWCQDLRTAVYVLSLPVFARGQALAVCPRCRQMFVQSRPDQTYDSVRCREAHRVARWRADQRKKGETEPRFKSGTNGSPKVSQTRKLIKKRTLKSTTRPKP